MVSKMIEKQVIEILKDEVFNGYLCIEDWQYKVNGMIITQ